MSRVLLIEDHERLAQLIAKGLAAAGIAVDVATRIDGAWASLSRCPTRP